ncbi:LexA repressor [Bacillus subtilis]|nr:LexA repressor [Bacillus subtilis]
MMNHDEVLSMLTENEKKIFNYIKETASEQGGSVKASMSKMGEATGLSEATAHRAVKKLRKLGIIGIVPSLEKAESNEIVYYGSSVDESQQIMDIMKQAGQLTSGLNRLESVLKTKEESLEKIQREKAELEQKVQALQQELATVRAQQSGIDSSKIISSQSLGDGTTAYIVKD